MAATGRAAVLVEPGKPFEVRELPIPEVEPDAALIRITLANICGSDLHVWRGEMGPAVATTAAGYVPGHEGSGRVAALGRNVTTDSLGRPLKKRATASSSATSSPAAAATPAWMACPTPAPSASAASAPARPTASPTSPAHSPSSIIPAAGTLCLQGSR